MNIDFYGMIDKISKSKFSIPSLVFMTFLYLIHNQTPTKTIVKYLIFVLVLSGIAILTKRILGGPQGPRVKIEPEELKSPLDPSLIRLIKVLENKGIKILEEIEKAIKKLRKRAFFIIESGENPPSVSVDKYAFCWSDAIKENISELKNFIKERLKTKEIEFVEAGQESGQEIIIFKSKNKIITLMKEGRSIILRYKGRERYSFILKKEKGKYNVYEKIGTRTTFFTQYINQEFVQKNRFRFPLVGTSSFLVFAKDISERTIVKNYRDFAESKYKEIHKELRHGNNRYLFNWNKVKKEDRERLMRFLREVHRIDWIYRARIIRSQDNKSFTVTKGNNHVKFSRTGNRVTMNINGDRSYKYILVKENEELKVYENTKKALDSWHKNFRKSSNLILVTQPYNFSIDYAIQLFSNKMNKEELDRLTTKMMDVMHQKIVIQNIRFSYLLEAVGYGGRIVKDFEELEDRVIAELANEFGLQLSDKDYFSKLLSQDNFMSAFNDNLKKLKRSLFRRISRSKTKFGKLKDLVGYINKHLEVPV